MPINNLHFPCSLVGQMSLSHNISQTETTCIIYVCFRLLGCRRQLHQLPVVVQRLRRTDPRVRALARIALGARLAPIDHRIRERGLKQLAESQALLVRTRDALLRLVQRIARSRAASIASLRRCVHVLCFWLFRFVRFGARGMVGCAWGFRSVRAL